MTIRVRLLPRLPARVIAGSGFSASVENGNLNVALDYRPIYGAPIDEYSGFIMAVQNPDTGAFSATNLSTLIGLSAIALEDGSGATAFPLFSVPASGVDDSESLKTILAYEGRHQKMAADARLTSRPTQGLIVGDGSDLDLGGRSILFDYTEPGYIGSHLSASRLRNGSIQLGLSAVLRRLISTPQDNGLFENLVVEGLVDEAHPQVNTVLNNNDATIRVVADRFTSRRVIHRNLTIAYRVYADGAVFEYPEFYNCRKGISLQDANNVLIIGMLFTGLSPIADSNPGHNAVGGGGNNIRVLYGTQEDTGEHGHYYAADDGELRTGLYVIGNTVRRTGQCAIKVRRFRTVRICNNALEDGAYGSVTGTNEDAIHLERCEDIRISGNTARGLVKDAPYYYGAYLAGCIDVEGGGEYYEKLKGAGIYICPHTDEDEVIVTVGAGQTTLRNMRFKDITCPALHIEHLGEEITGDIDIELFVDGCSVSPLTINADTIASGKKIKVRGRYKNCALPPPDFTDHAFIDTSEFLPDDDRAIPCFGVVRPAVRQWLMSDPSEPDGRLTRALDDAMAELKYKGLLPLLSGLTVFSTVGDARRAYDLIGGAASWGTTTGAQDDVGVVTSESVTLADALFSTSGGFVGVYVVDDIAEDFAAWGHTGTAGDQNQFQLIPRTTGGNLTARLGTSGANGISVPVASSRGFIAATWDATTHEIQKDGTTLSSGAITHSFIPSYRFAVGKRGSNSSTRQHSLIAIGPSKLTTVQMQSLYAALAQIWEAVGLE